MWNFASSTHFRGNYMVGCCAW